MPNVTINSSNIFYEVHGDGPPLLLLMGIGAHGALWSEHIAAYSKRFRCIVPDNRGAGRSGQPPGPYTTAQMADDTAALITSCNVGPVNVSGISMGGAIAQELALRHPSLVQRLILNCTWGRCDNYMRRIFETLRALAPTSPPRHFIRLIYFIIFTPAYHGAQLKDLLRREEELLSNPYPQSADAFAAQCDACISHDTLDRLAHIRVPTLITVGDKDIFTPPKFSEEIHRAIKGSELAIFRGGGHAHHWEQLEEYNDRTMRFLTASGQTN